MLDATQRLIAQVKRRLGCGYLWGGKGYVKWTPQGLASHGFTDGNASHPLFLVDCAGLITTVIYEAGGPDWRATHSAQMLLNECDREQAPGGFGTLHFYGSAPSHITHVKLSLDHGLFLESCGGDETTLAPKPGASVQLNFENRADFQEAGRLPLERLLK